MQSSTNQKGSPKLGGGTQNVLPVPDRRSVDRRGKLSASLVLSGKDRSYCAPFRASAFCNFEMKRFFFFLFHPNILSSKYIYIYIFVKSIFLSSLSLRMRVKKLPMILALHLKRFKYMDQLHRYTKLSYRVVFPLELRLFNTSGDATNPDRLYDLVAVVVHCGR